MGGFTATAQVGAAFANSTQIDLPRTVGNLRVTNNDTANPLFIAFDGGGPEVKVPFGKEVAGFVGSASSIFVRSTGGTAEFSVSFSYANPG